MVLDHLDHRVNLGVAHHRHLDGHASVQHAVSVHGQHVLAGQREFRRQLAFEH